MKAHVALSGFTQEELLLFRAKFDSLAEAMASEKHEERFSRVISIAGLPDIAPDQRIDMEKLLGVRSEPEAAEFRGWLADIDQLTDREIKDRVASLNSMLGRGVQTTTGKALRLLLATVVGVWNPVLGIASSTLDQFLWDKFFKRSGVAAFVNELYPSIFRTARSNSKL